MKTTRFVGLSLRLVGMLAVVGGLVIIAVSSTRTAVLIGGAIVVIGGLLAHWVRRAVDRRP
jgi:hypothetical protein